MKFLNYNDVFLVPRHSTLISRAEADPSTTFCGKSFKLPIIPANMVDVVDFKLANELCDSNIFYIMHRFFAPPTDVQENTMRVADFAREMNKVGKLTSISVGVGTWWEGMLMNLNKNKVKLDFITIDVAHADHDNVVDIIKRIKDELTDTKLIIGNVATPEGCEFLIKLGADAIKIGIGGGRICTTKNKTGFHVPMFSCGLQCLPVCEKYNIPFIADGGIEEYGDITKALVAGASMVMVGGLFAQCIDSPALIINGNKQYRGSTSYEMKGVNKHIEGKQMEIVTGITYAERLEEMKQALQSSISYGGGKDMSCFNHVEFVAV